MKSKETYISKSKQASSRQALRQSKIGGSETRLVVRRLSASIATSIGNMMRVFLCHSILVSSHISQWVSELVSQSWFHRLHLFFVAIAVVAIDHWSYLFFFSRHHYYWKQEEEGRQTILSWRNKFIFSPLKMVRLPLSLFLAFFL